MKTNIALGLSVIGLCLTSTMATGQDEPPVAPPSFVENAVIIAGTAEDGAAGQTMSFSVIGGSPNTISFMPGLGVGANASSMLSDRQIQSELVLVDEQMEKIREIQKEMQSRISEEMKAMRSEDGSLRLGPNQNIGAVMKEIREDAEQRFNDVLLPHQAERLGQIKRHLRMKQQGEAETLTNDEFAKELGLSDRQVARIRERAKTIEAELEKEIQRLRAEAKEKLFDELTATQRSKLKELLGDNFMYETPSPRQLRRQFNRPQPSNTESKEDK